MYIIGEKVYCIRNVGGQFNPWETNARCLIIEGVISDYNYEEKGNSLRTLYTISDDNGELIAFQIPENSIYSSSIDCINHIFK